MTPNQNDSNYNRSKTVVDSTSQTSNMSDSEQSGRDFERIVKETRNMVENFLEATNASGGISWSYCGTKRSISLFCVKNGQSDTPCNVHAGCKLLGEIEEVVECLICAKSDAMSSAFPDYKDGSTIESILYPSIERPYRYVGLKWLALSSSGSRCADQDFIVLEYVDLIEDASGEKYAFQIFQSVDAGALARSHDTNAARYSRGTLPLMGYIFHTTDKPGEIKMSYSCHLSALSGMLSHVERFLVVKSQYIELARTRREPILLYQQVIPTSEQDFCRLCEKGFYIWRRRRHNCYKCGGVVCGNCSSMQNVLVRDVGERHLRVCTPCVQEARRLARNEALEIRYHNLASQSDVSVDADQVSYSSSIGSEFLYRSPFDSLESIHDMLDFIQELSNSYSVISSNYKAISITKSADLLRSLSDGLIAKKSKGTQSLRKNTIGNLNPTEVFSSCSNSDAADILEGISNQQELRVFQRIAKQPQVEYGRKQRTVSCDLQNFKNLTVSARNKNALSDAIVRSKGLEESTASANDLAQHMRKLAYCKIQTSQMINRPIGMNNSVLDESSIGPNKRRPLCTTVYGSSPCLSASSDHIKTKQLLHTVYDPEEDTLEDHSSDSSPYLIYAVAPTAARTFSMPDIPVSLI